MSVLRLIRPELINGSAYVSCQDEAIYRLHANELPWCPVDAEYGDLNCYPKDSQQLNLIEQLATYYKVKPEEIALTRGSDDGIDMVMRLFLSAGCDALMQFPPTFSMYAFYARLQQAELIQCPLDASDNFNLTLDNIKSNWQPHCKIIIFCSPNNPTGNLMDLDLIAETCEYYKNRSIIVVDEAYAEFSSKNSALSLIPQFENLIVLRTLSKAFGLAGLRLGSIIAQKHIIDAFNKIIAPYALSRPVIELATNALHKPDWFSAAIETIRTSRDWLIKELKKIPYIQFVYPSEANFILIKTSHAQELVSWCSQQGIAIRDFPASSILHNHLRITVGSHLQNKLLIAAFSSFINNVSGLNYAKNLIY